MNHCPGGLGTCIYHGGCPGQCVRAMQSGQAVGKPIDEVAVRTDERERVLQIVRRNVHSSHFGRIEAKVNSDAKDRGAKADSTKAA